MKFTQTSIPGLLIIEPPVFRDERGFFFESYHYQKYAAAGVDVRFVQDNHSCSKKGILRGLHMQLKKPQGKLVRVLRGEIFDVAVDVRRGSPTFKKWEGVILSADNFKQLYIPPGFAHGFVALSDEAEMEYKVADFYDKNDEVGVLWNDPDLGIQWPVSKPILSERDKNYPRLCDMLELPTYKS